MITFNKKLQLEKNIFADKKYKKIPMSEVVAYLREYIAQMTGDTAYNSKVEDYIKSKEIVSDSMKDYLGTEVYLAQQFIKQEKKAKQTQEMADKGYVPCKEWNGYTGKAQIVGKMNLDWMTTSIDKVGKIIVTNGGKDGFFIPKGKRSRGYYLHRFEEGYYKALN